MKECFFDGFTRTTRQDAFSCTRSPFVPTAGDKARSDFYKRSEGSMNLAGLTVDDLDLLLFNFNNSINTICPVIPASMLFFQAMEDPEDIICKPVTVVATRLNSENKATILGSLQEFVSSQLHYLDRLKIPTVFVLHSFVCSEGEGADRTIVLRYHVETIVPGFNLCIQPLSDFVL